MTDRLDIDALVAAAKAAWEKPDESGASFDDCWRAAVSAVAAAVLERAAEEIIGVEPALLGEKPERYVNIYCRSRVDAAAAIRALMPEMTDA